ncbi:MAG: porin family protein [Prevotella sp.]|nr:porin family protein [Prevotella sp.]MCD8306206.1 porin family protein [Prevotella sp.]
MKKIIICLVLMLGFSAGAFAQFEKGKMYVAGSFDGLGISYSKATKFQFGLGVNAGYMVAKDVMLIAEAGFDFSNKGMNEVHIGADARYYIEQNGLFLQAGVKYVHERPNFNDLNISPEVGYCFFLNKSLTLEPAVYYDISVNDFSDHSKFGLKVGIGWFF